MIQGYVLSILFLVLSGLMFLQNKYRIQLSVFLRFSNILRERKKVLWGFFASGMVLFLVLFFFPLSPGPMVLGDLIPSLMILYDSIYFLVVYSKDENEMRKAYLDVKKEGRRVVLGWVNIILALVHFVFPSFVLL